MGGGHIQQYTIQEDLISYPLRFDSAGFHKSRHNNFLEKRLLWHGERRLKMISNGRKTSAVQIRTSGSCAIPTCESQGSKRQVSKEKAHKVKHRALADMV